MLKRKHAFIISLPRAGSTLLQRLLKANFRVSAPAEPWILLPLLWDRADLSMLTSYWGRAGRAAIREFFMSMPPGRFQAAVRSYYHEAVGLDGFQREGICFIDKTPRYSAVGAELVRIFPDAGYVFLWRSPVDIALSMVRTWEHLRPMFDRYRVDFVLGTRGFVEAVKLVEGGASLITYHELCEDPVRVLVKLRDEVGLPLLSDQLTTDLGEPIQGFGDPTGQQQWSRIRNGEPYRRGIPTGVSSIFKWRLISVLKLVDERYFQLGGTTRAAEMARVHRLRSRNIGILRDLACLVYSKLELAMQFRAMFRRHDPHPRLLVT